MQRDTFEMRRAFAIRLDNLDQRLLRDPVEGTEGVEYIASLPYEERWTVESIISFSCSPHCMRTSPTWYQREEE